MPDHLPNSTLSPAFTLEGHDLAALVAGAGADGDDLALLGLLGRRVGDDDAAGRLGFLSTRLAPPRGRARDGISWQNFS